MIVEVGSDCRQDPVHAVARGAVGDVLVAGLALEAVVRVDERGETLGGEPVLLVEDGRLVAGRAGDLGHLRARHRRARIRRRQDAVLPVAVRADRRVRLAAGDELPVDPLPEVVLDPAVALAAGLGDVEVVDRGLAEAGGQDLVRGPLGGVAVVAGRRDVHAALGRLAVHAALVDLDRVVDQDVVLPRDVQVLVALAAGLRELRGVRGRLPRARGQDAVRAVAVRALGQIAVQLALAAAVGDVLGCRIIMALRAGIAPDGEPVLLHVRDRAAIGVAVHALEPLVGRMLDVVGEEAALSALVVAVDAGIAADGLELLVIRLGERRGRRGEQEPAEKNRGRNRGPERPEEWARDRAHGTLLMASRVQSPASGGCVKVRESETRGPADRPPPGTGERPGPASLPPRGRGPLAGIGSGTHYDPVMGLPAA